MRLYRRQPSQRGFSLIELLIVIAIILVILAIAIPKANQVMMNGREMAAIREIQTIHQAQTQYYSQFGNFATSLQQLGPPSSGTANREGADLIPEVLAGGKHNGHIFTVEASPGGYVVQVVPEAFGGTGRRTFYSDQSLTIRNNWSQEPATAESDPIQ